MRYKLSYKTPDGQTLDLQLHCQKNARITDAATALNKTHQGNPETPQNTNIPARHTLTLALHSNHTAQTHNTPILLDPEQTITESPLHDGCTVSVTPEFLPHELPTQNTHTKHKHPPPTAKTPSRPRAYKLHGIIHTLNTIHRPLSIIAGENTIGRDPANRLRLNHGSISRHHATITAGTKTLLQDNDSTNGTRIEEKTIPAHKPHTLTHQAKITLGSTKLSYSAYPHIHEKTIAPPAPHIRTQETTKTLTPRQIQLPTPPTKTEKGRIPLIATLAPIAVGAILYTVIQNPATLLFTLFSPAIAAASWLDNKLAQKRKDKLLNKNFHETLQKTLEHIKLAQKEELETLEAKLPETKKLLDDIKQNTRKLWQQPANPKKQLHIRLGTGPKESVIQVKTGDPGHFVNPANPGGHANPTRHTRLTGATEPADPIRHTGYPNPANPVFTSRHPHPDLARIVAQTRLLDAAPIALNIAEHKNIGISGPAELIHAHARALLAQLAARYPPAEIFFYIVAENPDVLGEYAWLKWLPHKVTFITGPTLKPAHTDTGRQPDTQAGMHTSKHPNTPIHTAAKNTYPHQTTEIPCTPNPLLPISELENQQQNENTNNSHTITLIVNAATPLTQHLIQTTSRSSNPNTHTIFLAKKTSALPECCETITELAKPKTTAQKLFPEKTLGKANSSLIFRATETQTTLKQTETLDLPAARKFAKHISPIRARPDTQQNTAHIHLPLQTHLAALIDEKLFKNPDAITENWHNNKQKPDPMQATVGKAHTHPFTLNLEKDGPHALVGGTTGSGKSEFLQSWIMSLATSLSPAELNFLLFDYKGGSAFSECAELPHTVGLITDLDGQLATRVLTSLKAETQRRERLLAHHKTKDLKTLRQNNLEKTPARLILAIDEFATITKETPEFMPEILDLTARGRSLGIHLIMATQRPAGAIGEGLRANTNLRIALRVANETESKDIIGSADAAHFPPQSPGRAACKIGSNKITHFQTGYLGENTTNNKQRDPVQILPFHHQAENPQTKTHTETPGQTHKTKTDLTKLRETITQAAKNLHLQAPHRPWIEPLPTHIPLLPQLKTSIKQTNPKKTDQRQGTPIALKDLPQQQCYGLEQIVLEETSAIAFTGGSRSGKTTALKTLATALNLNFQEDPIEIYAIETAGQNLDDLKNLPSVAAVTKLDNPEACTRMLREIVVRLHKKTRKPRHTQNNNPHARQNKTSKQPRILLLIDEITEFLEAANENHMKNPLTNIPLTKNPEDIGEISYEQALHTILTNRNAGAHLVYTANRENLPARLAGHTQKHYKLRATQDQKTPPGRATTNTGETIQIAQTTHPGHKPAHTNSSSETNMQQTLELKRIGALLRAAGAAEAPPIKTPPKKLQLHKLPSQQNGQAVYGIDRWTLKPVTLPAKGLYVIAGTTNSGKTTACQTIIHAKQRHQKIMPILLSLTPTKNTGLSPKYPWQIKAHGEQQVLETAQNLLNQKLLTQTPAKNTAHTLLVIENTREPQTPKLLETLIALAKTARHGTATVIFQHDARPNSYPWELQQNLKTPSWGLHLQPEIGDTTSIFGEPPRTIQQTGLPPGHGYAYSNHTVTAVQVCFPQKEFKQCV